MDLNDNLALIRNIDQKDSILEELRKQGCRITEQRKTIIDIILQKECSCCKEIYAEVVKQDSSIGIATVYRMVNALEEIGVIDRRNLFKVSFSDKNQTSGECVAILKSQEMIRLSLEQFSQVIEVGLSMMEGFEDKEVASVMLNFAPSCIKVAGQAKRKESI